MEEGPGRPPLLPWVRDGPVRMKKQFKFQMSLHLANLSPHIRKDELERVFRKFGRCTVQLKDGYGFAVYEFRGDAEKALRTLKGRKISGESVYLSWSNKQPKPLQKFARTARSPDRLYKRNPDRGDNFVGHNIIRSNVDYSMSDKNQFDKGREKHKSSKVHDDRANFNLNNAGQIHYDQRDVVSEAAGRVNVEPIPLDNGRWEERSDNLQNGTDLDRYKPDYGAERVGDHESRGLAGTQSVGTSPEKSRRVHRDKKRGQQTCFKCGVAGHKMRDCRLKENLQENGTYNSDYRHDAIDKSGAGRTDLESRSRGWLRSSSRNSRSARLLDTDKKPSYSGKGGVDSRILPMENKPGRDMAKDSNRKRRREMNDHFVETHDDDKKSRVLDLSHHHSDYTAPELGTCSRSLKPSLGLSSQSRSGSHIPHPLSVSSRSLSKSQRSRSISRSSRSRSRNLKPKSRSRSPPSSLSISVGRPLSSSPKKDEVSLNGLSEGVPGPLPKEELNEVREQLELEGRENLCIADGMGMHLNGYSDNTKNSQESQLMEVLIDRKQSEHDSKTQTSTENTEINTNGFVEDDQIPQYQEAVPEVRQQLELTTMQDNELPQTDMSLLCKDVFSSGKVICDMQLDKLHNDVGSDSAILHASFGIEAPCSSLHEKDDKESAAEEMAAGKLTEIVEPEDSNALEMTKPLEPTSNSELKVPSKLHVGSHLNISAEELSRVLKHYGLEHPENKQNIDVGDYFGSSRQWPWELIYYRRLKKGPISMENYARRLAQNKAFSITDKYIRSSSGWCELNEENC